MTTIDDIITDILKAEGWDTYTNDPTDRGGPTKWGITQKAWSDYIGHEATEGVIQEISEHHARVFYEQVYVKAPRFDQLPPLLTPMVVDCGVNHGPQTASKWVQRAVGAEADGMIGPKTLDAVTETNLLAIYLRVCAQRSRFYAEIVKRDPTQLKYLKGWINRSTKWLDRLADFLAGG